jgi:hypothetical protein
LLDCFMMAQTGLCVVGFPSFRKRKGRASQQRR